MAESVMCHLAKTEMRIYCQLPDKLTTSTPPMLPNTRALAFLMVLKNEEPKNGKNLFFSYLSFLPSGSFHMAELSPQRSSRSFLFNILSKFSSFYFSCFCPCSWPCPCFGFFISSFFRFIWFPCAFLLLLL